MLVGVGIGHPVDPHDTAEFAALAASAGTLAVGTVLAARARPDPKYFVGSGKAEEIRACAGTYFDPGIVVAFLPLAHGVDTTERPFGRS